MAFELERLLLAHVLEMDSDMRKRLLLAFTYLLLCTLAEVDTFADDRFLTENTRPGTIMSACGRNYLTDDVAREIGFSTSELTSLRKIRQNVIDDWNSAKKFYRSLPESKFWDDETLRISMIEVFDKKTAKVLTETRRLQLMRLAFQNELALRLTEPAYIAKFELSNEQQKQIDELNTQARRSSTASPETAQWKTNTNYLTYKILTKEQRSIAKELCGVPAKGGWLESALDAEAKEQEADLAKQADSATTPATLSDDFP